MTKEQVKAKTKQRGYFELAAEYDVNFKKLGYEIYSLCSLIEDYRQTEILGITTEKENALEEAFAKLLNEKCQFLIDLAMLNLNDNSEA